jgi:hypothetical protein
MPQPQVDRRIFKIYFGFSNSAFELDSLDISPLNDEKIEALRESLSAIVGLPSGEVIAENLQEVAIAESIDRRQGEYDSFSLKLLTEAPLDKFQIIMRHLIDVLRNLNETFCCKISSISNYEIFVFGNKVEDLARLFIVAESILKDESDYIQKADSYVSVFGELTPSCIANLRLFGHRINIFPSRLLELNSRSIGLFPNLADKYSHFRRELLVCGKAEDLNDDRFWNLMLDKSKKMVFPEADANFLRKERLDQFENEEKIRQDKEKQEQENENKRRHEEKMKKKLYSSNFEEIARESQYLENLYWDKLYRDTLPNSWFNLYCKMPTYSRIKAITLYFWFISLNFSKLAPVSLSEFSQGILDNILSDSYLKGRWDATRSFYNFFSEEYKALEKEVFQQVYTKIFFL